MVNRYLYFTDERLVSAVISGEQDAVVYFFYEKFSSTFQYHIYNLFPYKVDVMELVNEFFLYLYKDDWHRLRTYDGSVKLVTWVSVVSFRFFKNYKHSMIDYNGLITISDKWDKLRIDWYQENKRDLIIDINNAISQITGERNKKIARRLFLDDVAYECIADEFGLSVDYVYTIKNRLLNKLKEILCV